MSKPENTSTITNETLQSSGDMLKDAIRLSLHRIFSQENILRVIGEVRAQNARARETMGDRVLAFLNSDAFYKLTSHPNQSTGETKGLFGMGTMARQGIVPGTQFTFSIDDSIDLNRAEFFPNNTKGWESIRSIVVGRLKADTIEIYVESKDKSLLTSGMDMTIEAKRKGDQYEITSINYTNYIKLEDKTIRVHTEEAYANGKMLRASIKAPDDFVTSPKVICRPEQGNKVMRAAIGNTDKKATFEAIESALTDIMKTPVSLSKTCAIPDDIRAQLGLPNPKTTIKVPEFKRSAPSV